MNLYTYEGPVLKFGKVIAKNWKGQTFAKSTEKAKNNLKHQFKTQNNYLSNVKITLGSEVKELVD